VTQLDNVKEELDKLEVTRKEDSVQVDKLRLESAAHLEEARNTLRTTTTCDFSPLQSEAVRHSSVR
jgi:hypothetical protein